MKKERTILPVVIAVCVCCVLFAALMSENNDNAVALSLSGKDRNIRVGVVLNGDESTTYSMNFIQALYAVQEQYGSTAMHIDLRRDVTEDQAKEVMEELAEDGCNLIVSNSYDFELWTKTVASHYSGIQFVQATGDNANLNPFLANYHTFMGRIYEGRYIAGQVAGRKLASLIANGTIGAEQAVAGYVAAFPNPEVISGFTAFYLGMKNQCPEASMRVRYTNTWGDYEEEFLCALTLIREGCVVISQHSDTEGPAAACEQAVSLGAEDDTSGSLMVTKDGRGVVYHVGYNQDMSDTAPRSSLISTRIDWSAYLDAAVRAVRSDGKIEDSVAGKIIQNDAQAGFDYGWVQMLPLNEPIAANGTAEMIAASEAAFRGGNLSVFKGDYHGVDPDDPSDTIDLNQGYTENEKSSAPSFHYILDGITVEE